MESGEGGGPQVTEQDIANIVAQWTGIPIEKVSSDETERLVKMEEVLHGRVIGQVRGCLGAAVWMQWQRAGVLCLAGFGTPYLYANDAQALAYSSVPCTPWCSPPACRRRL